MDHFAVCTFKRPLLVHDTCNMLIKRNSVALKTFPVNTLPLICIYLGSNLHSFTSYAVDYNHEWEIPRDQLVIGQKIGEGQFGLVLEGTLMTGGYCY